MTPAILVFGGALVSAAMCSLALLIRLGVGEASRVGVCAGKIGCWSALTCALAVGSNLASSGICGLQIRAGQTRLVEGLDAARERLGVYPQRLPPGLETVQIGWVGSPVAYRSEGASCELWFEVPTLLRAAYDSNSGRWKTLD